MMSFSQTTVHLSTRSKTLAHCIEQYFLGRLHPDQCDSQHNSFYFFDLPQADVLTLLSEAEQRFPHASYELLQKQRGKYVRIRAEINRQMRNLTSPQEITHYISTIGKGDLWMFIN